MPEKKRPRRTPQRILETSLALFNRFGEPHITTADIADEMNISPGNLYYHFRNKDDIIGALYEGLEGAITPLLSLSDRRAAGVEDLWLLLHLLFERMREYRFFYRDLDEITSRNRRIATRFAHLTRRGENTVIELCHGLVATGEMQATQREIASLASNVTLVSTYWMSFQRIGARHGGDDVDGKGGANEAAASLDRAAFQVLALIAPYLVGEGRALIDQLGENYL